ncbi:MAG: hypothetical protein WBD36_02395 [Bacteroidota bacterium]
MINNATPIISSIPGKHLDPLLLAQSQSSDSTGFIMIAYQERTTSESAPPAYFYDLLFFRGSEIYDCARMNQDLRFHLPLDTVLTTFKTLGRTDSTRLSLFVGQNEDIQRLRSTIYHEPCLKVPVRALSKNHIRALLINTGCRRGIIECNDFTNPSPVLDLHEVTSPEEFLQYQPKFRNGRLLLYDIEKCKDLVQQRYASTSVQRSTPPGHSQTSVNSNQSHIELADLSFTQEPVQPEPSIDEKEAEQFTQLIKQILNSPPSSAENTPNSIQSANQDSSGDAFVITRDGKAGEPFRTSHNQPNSPSAQKSKPGSKRPSQKSKQEASADARSDSSPTTHTVKTDNPSPDYIKLLERLFRSYRQQIFEQFGDKSEEVITAAEQKVRFLTPEFNVQSLNDQTAPLLLDLMEHIANDASFLKRRRLQEAALTLVADLYNKHFELLEQQRVIDKVEQFYYRLKR